MEYARPSRRRGRKSRRDRRATGGVFCRRTDTGSFPSSLRRPTMEAGFSRALRSVASRAFDVRCRSLTGLRFLLIIAMPRPNHRRRHCARKRRTCNPPRLLSIYTEARNSRHAHMRTLLCRLRARSISPNRVLYYHRCIARRTDCDSRSFGRCYRVPSRRPQVSPEMRPQNDLVFVSTPTRNLLPDKEKFRGSRRDGSSIFDVVLVITDPSCTAANSATRKGKEIRKSATARRPVNGVDDTANLKICTG